MRHIPGKKNSVADYLSRVMFLFRLLDFDDAEGEDEAEQLGTQILAVMEQQEEEADVVPKSFVHVITHVLGISVLAEHSTLPTSISQDMAFYSSVHGARSSVCNMPKVQTRHAGQPEASRTTFKTSASS